MTVAAKATELETILNRNAAAEQAKALLQSQMKILEEFFNSASVAAL